MNVKEAVSPFTSRKYTIRKLPLLYLSQFKHLTQRREGEEVTAETVSEAVKLLKASVKELSGKTEDEIIDLGEDFDFLFSEVVKINQPSEEFIKFFRGQAATRSSSSSGVSVQGEAK